MIQNAALDVAVGLALMYLMLSLLCTVINEFIASKLGLRAASLAAGLEEILDDPSVRARFYDHGLIASPRNAVTNSEKVFGMLAWRLGDLRAAVVAARSAPKPAPSSPPSGTLPSSPSDSATSPPAPPPENHSSYISSINFATALIGCLKAAPAPDKKVPGFAQIEAAVDALPETRLKSALQSTLATANDDVEKFQKNVAGWFDDSMERLSGAYKRDLQWLSIIIGLIVAILFNADSFGVAHKLWMDPNLRGSLVETAQQTVEKQPAVTTEKTGTATQPTDEDKLRDAIDRLRPLPIGWKCKEDQWLSCIGDHWHSLTLSQILGWLLTAAALSLGAPFWFDILSKLVNIRGNGPKPERADSQSKK